MDSLRESNKELIKKSHRIFRSKKHNLFTEEVNQIPLSENDEKRIQLIYSIETYAYDQRSYSKDLVCKKEEINCSNIKKNTKIKNFDCVTKEKEHNPNWLVISDNSYRI